MHKSGYPNVDASWHECCGLNVWCGHNRNNCYMCYGRNTVQQDNYDNKGLFGYHLLLKTENIVVK